MTRLNRIRLFVAALSGAALLGLATPTLAHAAGLAQPDFANDPIVTAILSVLGIGGVASLVGSFLDKAASAIGITTSALLWMLCFAGALGIAFVRGGVPLWGGDPGEWTEAILSANLLAKAGADVMFGLFFARLNVVKVAAAPPVIAPKPPTPESYPEAHTTSRR